VTRVRLATIVRTLPRWSHDLSRATVKSSQRWRILEAMIEVSARLGYGVVSVADVIASAKVSRKAFYELFDDKEDCFLAAYDVLSDRLIADLVEVAHDAQVLRFLTVLERDRASARVFMIDVLSAGPRALRRRDHVNQRFATTVFGDAAVDDLRREAVVGGVNNVVGNALLRGTSLIALAPQLSQFVRVALSR
jgi:AcrR family transcriptional regulator